MQNNLSLIFLSILFFPLISACSSSPQPSVSAPKSATLTWADLVKSQENTAPTEVDFTYYLWTQSTQYPSVDRVEMALASTGILADLNGSDGQLTISVGQGNCETTWHEVKGEMKRSQGEHQVFCSQSSDGALSQSLLSAQHVMKLHCKGPSGGGLVDLHNITVGVAKALQSPNAQEGEAIEEEFIAPVWISSEQAYCHTITKLNQYHTKDHLRFTQTELETGEYVIWTVGLTTFRLPELGFAFVPEGRKEVAQERLLALADVAIRFSGLSEGATAQSGSATGVYILGDRLAKKIKSLSSLQSDARQALFIVDPSAPVTDQARIGQLTRRFTLP